MITRIRKVLRQQFIFRPFPVILLWILSVTLPAPAQTVLGNSSDSSLINVVAESHPVLLKFIDSSTGAAVSPSQLLVDGESAKFRVEEGSLVSLSLAEGQRQLQISAEGYAPMEASISVTSSGNPVTTFELDPANLAAAEPVAAGHAVIEGHVTDADTGSLLENVTLSLPDSRLTTTTDTSGAFAFEVVVPATTETDRPVITFEAQRTGYQALVIRNLVLAEGERRRMPLTMDRLTSASGTVGPQVIDETAGENFRRNGSWVFDATIRN